jgi:dihydropyrimidinase
MARREGALTMIHTENHDCTMFLAERRVAEGPTEAGSHAPSRPIAAEREAAHRAITLAEITGAPILIVHVSAGEVIDEIRRAQARGVKVLAETCPQYLFLTADDLDKPGQEGARNLCSPPPRDQANQEAVWLGLQSGAFQVFSSDHAPTLATLDLKAPFTRMPNGVPGLETRLPLLFSEGVGKGRIDIHRFIELTATNPAKVYGLYPRKGTIAVGADADIAIWEAEREVTITADMLHHNVDFTPYEGMKVTGWPAMTLSRGDVVWDDGVITAERGRGRSLSCDTPPIFHRGVLGWT